MIVNEVRSMQKEVGIAYFKILQLLPPGTQKNHEIHESV
jgi:hypothetical protein